MQQGSPVLDAPGTDQKINGFANGDAAPAQGAEIASSLNGDSISRHGGHIELPEQGFYLLGLLFAVETLKDFAQHQIPDYDFVPPERIA